MNQKSKIETKVVHLTPPHQFQVAHQLPKDRPAESLTAAKSDVHWYKAITSNYSKIWAVKVLDGPWMLVSLFLKRCRRIDKNLLIAVGAIALLLLQIFLVISDAKADFVWSEPLSGLEQMSMLLTVPNRASSVSIPLSGIGVPPNDNQYRLLT